MSGWHKTKLIRFVGLSLFSLALAAYSQSQPSPS